MENGLKKISVVIFMRKIFICVAVITVSASSQGQNVLFSGRIINQDTVCLPSATIRVAGRTIGTISDKNGKFTLLLPSNTYTFIFSYVGYKSSSLTVPLTSDTTVSISLESSEIQLPEIIVHGEDPAYAIIREAIERKKIWKRAITEYKARVYTKDTFGRDTLLSLISEAYSELYYRRGDSLREVIIHRRQSSNLSEEFQLAAVRDFLNFNDDTVRQWGYTFITPLAESAFQYYDYKLLRTYSNDGGLYYDIEVIPNSKTIPLFSGTITIVDSSYALQKVTLSPNKVFQVPLLTIYRFEFSQQFSLYENRFWLPIEYDISAEMKFRFFSVISSPPVYYNKSVICYEYLFHPSFGDSIQSLPAFSMVSSVDHQDTALWKDTPVFPLSPLERESYKKIDELVQSRPLAFQLEKILKQYNDLSKVIDVRYNRAEGLFLGGKYSRDVIRCFHFSIHAGYGVSLNRMEYTIASEVMVHPEYSLSLGVEGFHRTKTFPLNYAVDELSSSLASFFDGDDYYNYYFAQGGRAFLSIGNDKPAAATLSLVYENEFSLPKATDFSLKSIGSTFQFRDNPPISGGKIMSLLAEVHSKQNSEEDLFQEPHTVWSVRAEHSLHGPGNFKRFTSFYGNISGRMPTMGTTRLFNPYVGISFSIGRSFGDIPVQRTFAVDPPLSRFTGAGSFRTVKNGEFSGDNFYALAIEHNFRNMPFLLIGIPSVSLDIIIRAATTQMRVSSAAMKNLLTPPAGNYTEYTIGFGRIADIFRIDLSYSDYSSSRYTVTFTGSL